MATFLAGKLRCAYRMTPGRGIGPMHAGLVAPAALPDVARPSPGAPLPLDPAPPPGHGGGAPGLERLSGGEIG